MKLVYKLNSSVPCTFFHDNYLFMLLVVMCFAVVLGHVRYTAQKPVVSSWKPYSYSINLFTAKEKLSRVGQGGRKRACKCGCCSM